MENTQKIAQDLHQSFITEFEKIVNQDKALEDSDMVQTMTYFVMHVVQSALLMSDESERQAVINYFLYAIEAMANQKTKPLVLCP